MAEKIEKSLQLDGECGRRDFVKYGVAFAAGLVALVRVAAPNAAFAQAATTKPLDPEAPMPKALGYGHDVTKIDPVKWPRRKEAGAEKQACANCILLQSAGLKADGQAGEWGKCSLFPDGLVNVKGWCNSYAAKPGA